MHHYIVRQAMTCVAVLAVSRAMVPAYDAVRAPSGAQRLKEYGQLRVDVAQGRSVARE